MLSLNSHSTQPIFCLSDMISPQDSLTNSSSHSYTILTIQLHLQELHLHG